ncbi:hypothetical protein Skr01_19970 [Sphaerisporangium krabiense]|uniref:Quercetin dioxygenase-like cupin family protein n=1 Tax=Sphaerisporangium krabiense TaxID=763782 RepID=A0A7W8Z5E8_9ACTN|nr:cupin domain-containing protein [Sphaerisporangium krabiense]MBB5627754.1 quercetin dioxygenase-like cupin family protein [Sphaerisporangium krabiense]GII61912.1 hypothetical protein Skr01_19970 [Sphaerisporangium krabiense]
MPVIRHAQSRRTETPNAIMTTYASPTQGGAGLSLWRVEMEAGQTGPAHAFDAELVWTVLSGEGAIELGAESFTIAPGDTVVLPAGVRRRLSTGSGLALVAAAPAGARAYTTDGAPDVPGACAAPEGDMLLPAWMA